MTRKSWKDLVDQPVKAEAQDEGLDTVPSLDEVATSHPVLSKLMKEQAKLKQNMDQVLKSASPRSPSDSRFRVASFEDRRDEIARWDKKRRKLTANVQHARQDETDWAAKRDKLTQSAKASQLQQNKMTRQFQNTPKRVVKASQAVNDWSQKRDEFRETIGKKPDSLREVAKPFGRTISQTANDWSQKRDEFRETIGKKPDSLRKVAEPFGKTISQTANDWLEKRDEMRNQIGKKTGALRDVPKPLDNIARKAASLNDKYDENRKKLRQIYGGDMPQGLESLDDKLQKIKNNMAAKRALERSSQLRDKAKLAKKSLKDWENKRDKDRLSKERSSEGDKTSKALNIDRNLFDLDERRRKAQEKRKAKKAEEDRLNKRSKGRRR